MSLREIEGRILQEDETHIMTPKRGVFLRKTWFSCSLPKDGALQIIVPEKLREQMLILSYYLTLAVHSGIRKMYDTMSR